MAAVQDEWDRTPTDAQQRVEEGYGASGTTLLRVPRRRSRGIRRACLAFGAFVVSILCVGLIGGGLFFARLSQGPINVDLAMQVSAALNERVGNGYRFELGGTSVEGTEHGAALTLDRLAVTDAAHHPVITAPRAAIGVDPLALLTGDIRPRQLDIRDVDLRLLILADGQVAVSAGTGAAAVPLSRAFAGPTSAPNDRARPVGEALRAVRPSDRAPTSAPDEDAAGSDPTNAALQALTAVLRSLVDATTTAGGALGTLDNVNVTGRLLLDDRTHGTTSSFTNTELNYSKSDGGSAVLKVAADGPTGRWSIAARATRGEDGAKGLTVEVQNLSLDEITLAGGLRNLGFDFDMPVSGSASVRFDARGLMMAASGKFHLGSGYFKLDDPDHEPLMIDAVSGGFHFDPATRNIAIESTRLQAGESDFQVMGEVGLPHTRTDPFSIKLQSSGTFGAERPGERPIKIARAGMSFRLLPAERRFVIDTVAIEGPDVAFQSAGEVRLEGDGVRVINVASVKRMPAPVLVRLWPSFIAAPVRAWFLNNLRGGMVESGRAAVNLTDSDFALFRVKRSVPDDHIRVDYTVSDLSLRVMNGVPNLTGLDGSGVVTGDTSSFVAQHGEMQVTPGHKLTLADGKFDVPTTDPKPTPAIISVHALGSMETAADLLSRDALKPFANLPIDATAVKGQIDAHLNIALKLGDHVPADDAKVTATADVSNFTADKLIGKEGLVETTLQLVADKSGLRARGEGRMYGAPASLELRKPSGNGPSEAVIALSLDDAARLKAGLNLGKALTGIVTAKISTSLAQSDKTKALVDLDFTKAGIDGLLPGFSKPAGRPGKATMAVTQREGANTALDNIVFDAGTTSVRGSAELTSDGSFESAHLSQIRLSPGDDLKLDASQSGDALRLVARGANFDARPFLKWLTGSASPSGSDGSSTGKNVDIELHSNVLTGQNSQAISNADVRFSRRGGQLRSLQVTGRFGRQPINVTTVQQDGAPVLLVRSSDAGNSLAFMDLYRRMVGGRLEANLTFGPNRLDGFTKIYDFTVREDPSIKKLAQEGLATQSRMSDTAAPAHIDASAVPFTKLEASFMKMGSRVSVREGALYGPQVGATVSGTLDLGRDQVNLEGTFVPLYGVNNLFSQIPLFGPILGGGTREGLFGVNYRITGSTSSPVLNVNPLSAMAPGFLRKIFGAIDDADFGGLNPRDQATGSVPLPGPGEQ